MKRIQTGVSKLFAGIAIASMVVTTPFSSAKADISDIPIILDSRDRVFALCGDAIDGDAVYQCGDLSIRVTFTDEQASALSYRHRLLPNGDKQALSEDTVIDILQANADGIFWIERESDQQGVLFWESPTGDRQALYQNFQLFLLNPSLLNQSASDRNAPPSLRERIQQANIETEAFNEVTRATRYLFEVYSQTQSPDDLAVAKDILLRAIRQVPSSAGGHTHLGIIAAIEGDLEVSRIHLEAARQLALQKGQPDAADNIESLLGHMRINPTEFMETMSSFYDE